MNTTDNLNSKKVVRNKKYKSPNENILKNIHISSQENTLIITLDNFFKNKLYMDTMLPIVNGYSVISLRALDWFVTNYSKNKKISYLLRSSKTCFNVHYNYKAQLKAFNKKFFDPFCRGNRIPFFYDNENCIITTIGQLNFFKWAISNNVINSINKNLKVVEKDMNESYKKNIACNTNKKRKELSISASRTITKENIRILVSFD